MSEYFYKMNDKDLLNVILQVTGAEASSSAARQILSTIKALKEYAKFDESAAMPSPAEIERFENTRDIQSPPLEQQRLPDGVSGLGLNLAYTINLNLPATSDQAVFNAIFRSLKENLLSND